MYIIIKGNRISHVEYHDSINGLRAVYGDDDRIKIVDNNGNGFRVYIPA